MQTPEHDSCIGAIPGIESKIPSCRMSGSTNIGLKTTSKVTSEAGGSFPMVALIKMIIRLYIEIVQYLVNQGHLK